MVPLMKKHASHLARIQVLAQHDAGGARVVVAFLDDFVLGRCMSFVVRPTDACEAVARSAGRFAVRFVDAKFAPPRPKDEAGSEFLCLDVRDYAAEHDDIIVEFDSEAGTFRGSLTCSCGWNI